MRRGGSASPPSPALPIGLQARARIGSAPQSSKGARTAPQEKQGPSTEKGGRPSQQKAELRILGDPVIAGTCSFPPFLLIWGMLVSPCSFPHKPFPCHAYRRTNTPLNKPIVGKTPEERWGGGGRRKGAIDTFWLPGGLQTHQATPRIWSHTGWKGPAAVMRGQTGRAEHTLHGDCRPPLTRAGLEAGTH